MFLSNDLNEIRKQAQNTLPRPDGFQVLLKIYAKEEKSDGGIVLTDEIRSDEVYRSIVGLVLDKGPVAYEKGEVYEKWNKCEVGDWVIFRANAGSQFFYREIPLRSVAEEQILAKLPPGARPKDISRD